MKVAALVFCLSLVPTSLSLCMIQSCNKWWTRGARTVSRMNPFSSCVGPRLKDDIESLVVMPGCTLEVWDHGSGLKNAKAEERKSYNAGNYKDAKDRYKRNKLVFSAFQNIQIVEEINDDFDDMDEDIESYRCRCQ